jgi:hypothetical protein
VVEFITQDMEVLAVRPEEHECCAPRKETGIASAVCTPKGVEVEQGPDGLIIKLKF